MLHGIRRNVILLSPRRPSGSSSEMEGNKKSSQISLYLNKPREESFPRGWAERERDRDGEGRNGKLKEDDPDGRGKKSCALLPPNEPKGILESQLLH